MPEFPFFDFATITHEGLRRLALVQTALRWFQNGNRGAANTDVAAKPNHVHLIGATRIPLETGCGTKLGETVVTGGSNVSWIYVQRIEEATNALTTAPCEGYRPTTMGRNVDMVKTLTVAHELTHQWSVNHPQSDAGGHCQESSYEGNGNVCLMNAKFFATAPALQIDTGRAALHYRLPDHDSEYRTIRELVEPIPQQ